MKLSYLVYIGIAAFAAATPAVAQPDLPGAALVAEGEGRWDDAIRIYREAVAQSPSRADLWLRIADIEAAQGEAAAALHALEVATRLEPSDATVWARLSAAYSAANRPDAAIEKRQQHKATPLRPRDSERLPARAQGREQHR